MNRERPLSRPRASISLTVLLAGSLALALPDAAEAKRLGGKRSVGVQRQADAPSPATPPKADPNRAGAAAATPSPAAPLAAPAAAAAGTAAAAARPAGRSWLGPVAGVAAGLGLMALASHLGFGEGLASLMLILLLAVAGFALVRLLRGRLAGGPRPALAGAGVGRMDGLAPAAERRAEPSPAAGWGAEPAPLGPTAASLEQGAAADGMDPSALVALARELFIRLQAANDAGEAETLRAFMTPELFGHVESEIMARPPGVQRTEVLQLEAELVESLQEGTQHWVGVRFHGLIREEGSGPAEPFDERWNLCRPADGSRPWAIAGIQQLG